MDKSQSLQAIAADAARAAANFISAGDAEVLLDISRAIAAVRGQEDLLRAVVEKIKPLFEVADCGILIIDRRADTYHDLLVLNPRIEVSEGNDALSRAGFYQEKQMRFRGSALAGLIDEFARTGSPVIFDYQKDYADCTDNDLLQTLREMGYGESIAAPLENGGEIFGALLLNSKLKNNFRPVQFPLARAVADLLATGVANVLANEEVLERTREKAVLLSISEIVATVKDKRDLLKLIFEKVQPLFEFYDAGLCVFNHAENCYEDWVAMFPEISPSPTSERLHRDNNYKIPADDKLFAYCFEEMERAGQPIVVRYDESFVEGMKDFPHMKIELEHGYREVLAAVLKTGGETIGILNLNSLKADHFARFDLRLFQAIADQIATAVANILANEEILERTREKSLLLSISEDIAGARNAVELLQVIRDKARRLIPFHDTGILIVEADGEHHYDLSVTVPGWDNSEGNVKLQENKDFRRIAYRGTYTEHVMNRLEKNGGPVIEDWTEALRLHKHPYFSIADNLGYREAIVGALKSSGKTFGSLWLNSLEDDTFHPGQFEIFQALADQVAVAVANILANEEIIERTREKALLLSLSEDMAKIRFGKDLLKVVYGKVRTIFPFEDAGLFVLDAAGENHRDLFVDYNLFDEKLYATPLPTGWLTHTGSVIEGLMKKPGAFLVRLDDMIEEFPGHPHYPAMHEAGLKQIIGKPLMQGERAFGLFVCNATAENAYAPKDIPLFNSISNQISVAVANILANEEIEAKLLEITELKKQLERDKTYLAEEIERKYNFGEIVGASPKIYEIFDLIEHVAPTDATVLIRGETGTGKELVARAVHHRSPRAARPLIKVNCAALPRELVESELFGHEKGAFTGATAKRIGKFELAHGSTIFLDEIGELPLDLQIKLLRVLQEKEIERLGGKGAIALDLRVVAATNRDLPKEVAAGNFRADLYYRLNTVEIVLPALRERQADILPLTMHFAEKYAAKFSRRVESVSSRMLAQLGEYAFPGNIRELEHIVEQAVIFSKSATLELPRPLVVANRETDENGKPGSDRFMPKTLENMERDYLLAVLERTGGRVKGAGGAAEILDLKASTLYSKLAKLGIKKQHYAAQS